MTCMLALPRPGRPPHVYKVYHHDLLSTRPISSLPRYAGIQCSVFDTFLRLLRAPPFLYLSPPLPTGRKKQGRPPRSTLREKL